MSYDTTRPSWLTPCDDEVATFVQEARDLIATLLPKAVDPWSVGYRRQAVDLAAALMPDRWVGDPADRVGGRLVRLPDPYAMARSIAKTQGLTWADAADPLLFAALNRGYLSRDTYDRLTGPWRVVVGPLHIVDRDPVLSSFGKRVGAALLRAGGQHPTLSVEELMAEVAAIENAKRV